MNANDKSMHVEPLTLNELLLAHVCVSRILPAYAHDKRSPQFVRLKTLQLRLFAIANQRSEEANAIVDETIDEIEREGMSVTRLAELSRRYFSVTGAPDENDDQNPNGENNG